MITQFKFKNFRSFKEEVVINFTDKNKLIVIYGANASGKSNLFKAFEYFRNAISINQVVNNTSPSNNTGTGNAASWTVLNTLLQPFKLNKKTLIDTTNFEIIIEWSNTITYRYGFSVSCDTKKIVSEFLFIKEKNKSEKSVYFRDYDNYDEGIAFNILQEISSGIRDDILALPHLLNRNEENSKRVFEYIYKSDIKDMLDFKIESPSSRVLSILETNENIKNKVLNILNSTDFFIKEFKSIRPTVQEFENIKNNNNFFGESINADQIRTFKTSHFVYDDKGNRTHENENVDLDLILNESNGTRTFIVILTILFNMVEHGGGIIFLDEANTAMHPLLMKELVKIIKSLNNIQVIICTHDVGLLSKDVSLDKSAIFFVEKNSSEESELYSLADIEGVRAHPSDKTAIDKQYLEGRFGAVPYIVEQNYEKE